MDAIMYMSLPAIITYSYRWLANRKITDKDQQYPFLARLGSRKIFISDLSDLNTKIFHQMLEKLFSNQPNRLGVSFKSAISRDVLHELVFQSGRGSKWWVGRGDARVTNNVNYLGNMVMNIRQINAGDDNPLIEFLRLALEGCPVRGLEAFLYEKLGIDKFNL